MAITVVPIPGLPAFSGTPADADLLALSNNGVTKKIDLSTLFTRIGALNSIVNPLVDTSIVNAINSLYNLDASATQRGLVNTDYQTFQGIKSFFGDIYLGESGSGNALKIFGADPSFGTSLIGPSTQLADLTLLLPGADGTSGQALITDGAGQLSFSSFMTASLQDGYIFVGNASNVATAVQLSGDVTITNDGVATIANDAITTAKILDNNVTDVKIVSLGWGKITGKPTTLAGYGITDAIKQGGNSFGASMVVGTNDTQPITLAINGASAITIDIGRNVKIDQLAGATQAVVVTSSGGVLSKLAILPVGYGGSGNDTYTTNRALFFDGTKFNTNSNIYIDTVNTRVGLFAAPATQFDISNKWQFDGSSVFQANTLAGDLYYTIQNNTNTGSTSQYIFNSTGNGFGITTFGTSYSQLGNLDIANSTEISTGSVGNSTNMWIGTIPFSIWSGSSGAETIRFTFLNDKFGAAITGSNIKSTIHNNGSYSTSKIRSFISPTATATADDYILYSVSAVATSTVLNLPAISTVGVGKRLVIKNTTEAGATLDITPNGTDRIERDGVPGAVLTLSVANELVELVAVNDGIVFWMIK